MKDEQKCDIVIDIGLIGNSDVGKTCLIRKFQKQEAFQLPKTKISTIGVDQVTMKLKIESYLVKVTIWDPAGQERFESVAGSFFQKLDGVMLVFDLTNEKSFQNLTKWLSQVNQVKNIPYMISGNKADLELERIVSDDEIKDIENKFSSQCFYTSAKTGENVDLAFHTLINMIMPQQIRRLQEKKQMEEGGVVNLSKQKHRSSDKKSRKDKKSCC